MSINIGQVNEPDVIKLAKLMQRKELLIRDMRNAVERLNKDKTLTVEVKLRHGARTDTLRNDERLKAVIDSQSEWIIDRIYDTAIHNLENEISLLADKVMINLVSANSRTITF